MRGWIADQRQLFRAGRDRLGHARAGRGRSRRIPPIPDYRPGEIVTGWFGWQEIGRPSTRPPSCVAWPKPTCRARSRSASSGINGVTALVGLDRDRRTRGLAKPCSFRPRRARWDRQSGKSGKFSAAGRSASPAARKRSRNAAISLATTRRSITRAGIDEALAAACPDGVHVYFDNTSGAISDAVCPQARGRRARGRSAAPPRSPSGTVANRAAARTPSARQARPSAGVRDIRSHGSLGDVGRAVWPTGCAPASCAIRKTSSKGSKPVPTHSPDFIAARTRASV